MHEIKSCNSVCNKNMHNKEISYPNEKKLYWVARMSHTMRDIKQDISNRVGKPLQMFNVKIGL